MALCKKLVLKAYAICLPEYKGFRTPDWNLSKTVKSDLYKIRKWINKIGY